MTLIVFRHLPAVRELEEQLRLHAGGHEHRPQQGMNEDEQAPAWVLAAGKLTSHANKPTACPTAALGG